MYLKKEWKRLHPARFRMDWQSLVFFYKVNDVVRILNISFLKALSFGAPHVFLPEIKDWVWKNVWPFLLRLAGAPDEYKVICCTVTQCIAPNRHLCCLPIHMMGEVSWKPKRRRVWASYYIIPLCCQCKGYQVQVLLNMAGWSFEVKAPREYGMIYRGLLRVRIIRKYTLVYVFVRSANNQLHHKSA